MVDADIDYNQLVKEINQLKEQVTTLEKEMKSLKENIYALGYIPEDAILSDEEKKEIEGIKELVENGDLSQFEELK